MDYSAIETAMAELEEDDLLALVQEVVASGTGAQEAIEAMAKGMDQIGALFETGEYFVGDLIFAGDIMTEAMDLLKPMTSDAGKEGGEKVILCTVKNDLHDIGKNIVRSILESGGFQVLDLGIDTPSEKIVEEVKTNQVKIVALSGVLTLAIDSMKDTVNALKAAGLDDVKVVIGGAPVNEEVRGIVGADAWADSPQRTLAICREWSQQLAGLD